MLPLLIDAVLDTILIDDILLLVAARSFAVLIETTPDEKNPYSYEKVCARIVSDLGKLNFIEGQQYIIMQLPNIKDVNYDKR